MPRRKSLTRRFLQHLLLIPLARAILNVVGRGRAYDDWDEGKLVEPAVKRSHKSRFTQTLSFGALFFAGLALSAGAGNGVNSLLDAQDGSTPAAGASGASGPTGATGATATGAPASTVLSVAPERTAVEGSAPTRPVSTASAAAPARSAVASSAPSRSSLRPVVAPATKQRTAIARTHAARPAARTHARPHHKAPAKQHVAPKAPPLDPEVHSFAAATVWLNRAAVDP